MYSFLLSARWVRLIAASLVVGAGCVALGLWQFDRLGERQARNELINRSLRAAPVPLERVLPVERELAEDQQWRKVEVRGRYDAARELLVRNRILDGKAGYYVLTPLVSEQGPALLVLRGWIAAGPDARTRPAVPAPNAGTVTAVVRLRASEPPAQGQPAPAGEIRRIDVPAIAETLPYDVYGTYGELVDQRPAAEAVPRLLPAPKPAEGPHLAYAFQWFVFGLIAVGGVAFLARREAQDGVGTAARR